MAEFPAKAISATPVGASRPEGADAAATVELLDPASSSLSKTRSSNVNEESVEAGVPHVNANNAICQAPTVEDDELRSQSSGVCPQGAWTDAGSVEHRPEEGVSAGNLQGLGGTVAAAAATSSALSAASLFTQLKLMVLCGSGGPVASGLDQPHVEVTKELVLLAAEAVTELFATHEEHIKLACGVLDAREALAYLIGDAAGFGLITAESARKAGDKAAKLVWVKKGTASIKADLAEAERAVQRRAGKLPAGVSIEKELADARADVLRTAVELPVVKRPVERSRPRPPPLPPPPPPLPPPPPPPPPAELDPCLIRWCKNQARGLGPKDVVAHMSERIHRRKKRERAWRPTCPRDAAEKAALRHDVWGQA